MHDDLRELVRRYFRDEISYEQYRNARTQIIDAVAGTDSNDAVSDTTVPHVRAPTIMPPQAPPMLRATGTQTKAGAQSQAEMQPRRPPPTVANPATQAKAVDRRRVWLIGAGVLGLLGVISGLLVHKFTAPAQTPATAVEERGTPGQNVLAAFLRSKDWSAGGIADFSRDWDALDPAARETARHTPEFQRLADALYQRIAEQRALEEVGTVTSSQSKQIITALARHLGINYGPLQAKPVTSPSVKKPAAME